MALTPRPSSLAHDDIPIKLRCAICSKLAVNAYRLPCCEQAICENCELLPLAELSGFVTDSTSRSFESPRCLPDLRTLATLCRGLQPEQVS